MVMEAHNDLVNTRSQSHIDVNPNHFELLSFLRNLNANMEAIQHLLEVGQIDIDQYLSESASGNITLTNPIRNPWLLTDIIATYPTTSTQVIVSIRDRIFLPSPTAGLFELTGMHGMQMGPKDKITLVVTPAAACFMEIMGKSDYRKIERLGNE